MQIIPIKDLKNTADISERCHQSQEPIFITKNGYGDMVIMSMETYEKNMVRVNMYQELELAEKEIGEGLTKPALDSLSKLRGKYEL